MAVAGEMVKLRLVLVAPPKGVWFSLQGKDAVVEQQTLSTGADITFDLSLRVVLDGPAPKFLGDYARGDAADRFFYFASGIYAGAHLHSGRRGKVKLAAIPEAMIRQALASGGVLQATTAGTAKDGGAACASVKSAWEVVAG